MTVTISQQFDCTQREFIRNLCNMIYAKDGCKAPADIMYFHDSQHPQEKAILSLAEAFFEMLTGDSPDYSDDEDDE